MNRRLAACAVLLVVATPAGAAEPISFNRDVRPILSDNCFFCHGPDIKHRKADLRLDVRDVALESEAIVPGRPGESAVIARIFSADKNELMPPPSSHKKLTVRQKEILVRWVEEGAEYRQHWAYERPVKATTPSGQVDVDVLVRQKL